ncbi:MAG: hypothetical protein PUC12_01495 [Clostridiales bacterium]|nr:hypothetical protein [Clostridiales bacterium]
MNREAIKKGISIILILSLLVGANGNIHQGKAAASSPKEKSEEEISTVLDSGTETLPENSEKTEEKELVPDTGDGNEMEDSSDSDFMEETVSAKDSNPLETDETIFDERQVLSEDCIQVYMDSFTTENDWVELPLTDNGEINESQLKPKTLYGISRFDQWIALAKYSQKNSLDGYRFCYFLNNSVSGTNSDLYDFTTTEGSDFQGLGSKEFPFKGELFSNYAVGNITLKLGRPLFNYLSSKAKIYNIKIATYSNPTSSIYCTAGLAEHLVADTSATDAEAEYSNITVISSGDTLNQNVYAATGDGVSGGLFAYVDNVNSNKLTIKGSSIAAATIVRGKTAGGLIGKVTGNVQLNLDGFYFAYEETKGNVTTTYSSYTAGLDSGWSDSVGGVIGSMNCVSETSAKAEIILQAANEVHYTHNNKEFNGMAVSAGGLIGSVSNVNLTVNCPLKYTGGTATRDITGQNTGVFAGNIQNSNIILNNQFYCNDSVHIYILNKDQKECNAGIFAGFVNNSEIRIGDSWAGGEKSAVEINMNSTGSDYNINPVNSELSNVGGLVGYAYDTNILFSEAQPCNIQNFKTTRTRGNISGMIGKYEVSDALKTVQYINVSGTSRLVGRDGCIGGLIGYVYMNSGNAKISKCTFGGKLGFISDYLSMGVAKAESKSGSDAKLILDGIQCQSESYECLAAPYNLIAYGGAIGLAASDFEIRGTGTVQSNFIVGTKTNASNSSLQYYGGLVGKVQSDRNEEGVTQKRRKGYACNVTVGKCSLPYHLNAAGGFFGMVESNCAIALDGKIEDITIENEVYYDPNYDAYVGTIAGEIDNALIYMEPDADDKSGIYTCDKIGNYGGVIRNGYYDSDESSVNRKKLIEDYEITGTLSDTIATTGDLIRFAIAMNTQGIFMPEGNQEESASIKDIEVVRTKSYQLTGENYDLTNSGVVCLARNDDKGITESPFTGSLIGTEGSKSTINYTLQSHNQKNIGLFPKIAAGESSSQFKNLNLEYTLEYKKRSAGNIRDNNKKTDLKPKTEHAGGLAAVATGNITVENVSYTGTITDVNNSTWNWSSDEPTYSKNGEGCLGGIFGTYIGTEDTTLTMNTLTTNMNFKYCDLNHVMGGVIGYVDLDQVTDGKSCKIQMGSNGKPICLSGTIDVSIDSPTNGSKTVNKLPFALQESGMITLIGKPLENGQTYDYKKKCSLIVDNLSVNGVSVTQSNDNLHEKMGGFLGYSWKDVEASLSNIQVAHTGENKLEAKAAFGGLVHTVCGKMKIEKAAFGPNAQFSSKNAEGIDRCGLLVRNGQNLYLDVQDYTVSSGIKLTDYAGSCFDEVTGFTKGGDDENHGGIVSIGHSAAGSYYLGRNGQEYQSYPGGHVVGSDGQPVQKSNPNTRYYYDLNKLEWTNTNYASLTTADEVLKWHLLHYANKGIRKCMDSGYSSLPNTYNINNNIDLYGYSIYPTPTVPGETYHGGTIIFHAKEIINGEAEKIKKDNNPLKYPEDNSCQHYQMQSGLLDDVSNITVENLTLQGTCSITARKTNAEESKNFSGALVAGSVQGIVKSADSNGKKTYDTTKTSTFENITLSNLFCVSEKSSIDYNAPLGLMISDISSGAQVVMDGICMSGYTDNDIGGASTELTDDKKAASALIGNVGGSDAVYISLSFKNMDIADAASGKSAESLHSSKMDEALAKASFIYSYDYMENCNSIYIFNYEDYLDGRCTSPASKKITLGKELGNNNENPNYAIEEYFNLEQRVGKLKEDNKDKEITYDCENYIPYVYTTAQKILVNPKVGNLTTGCGTYEDPYVIQSAKQLITLYRYLYDEDNFKDILEYGMWSVNPVGDDSKLCDKTNTSTNGHGNAIQYKNNDFPSKAQLSQAYYQITNDIDLSGYSEFRGFGRIQSDMPPFTGVFVGKRINKNNQYPTITMSKVSETNSVENYGFIQAAKGCVVKDLVIQFNQPVIIRNTVTIKNTDGTETTEEYGTGGGVIATVLGGENIIDNVTVTGQDLPGDKQYCFTPGADKVRIGGYVGVVNAGGVILRNMKEDSLSGFRINYAGGTVSQRIYTCGIIGRVFDGYVVYDDDRDTTNPLLKQVANVYSNSSIQSEEVSEADAQSRSYDIINGGYLKDSRINWTAVASDTATKGYTIADAKQLQIISMALNSGMLNYDAGNKTIEGVGYNQVSRQRSGNYDYVGAGNFSDNETDAKNAREDVICQDNMNHADTLAYHSYLSRFFNWGGSSIIEVASGETFDGMRGKAVLNPSNETLTYTLSGTDYDMSVFGNAFRGLGARYFKNVTPRENTFHSSFIAPAPATIKLNMVVDGIQGAEDAALFNSVKVSNAQNLTIKKITLTGTVINKADVGDTFSEYVRENNAAGFITTAKNVKLDFENVLLDQLQVNSQKYAAGMVGHSSNGSVSFKNCGITGQPETTQNSEGSVQSLNTESQNAETSNADTQDAGKTVILGRYFTGGFVAHSTDEVTINKISKLEHLHVKSYAKAEETNLDDGNSVGGLIGRTEGKVVINGVDSEGNEENGTVKIQPCMGNDIIVETNGMKVQAGGLVGIVASGTSDFQNITLKNLKVINSFAGTKNDGDKNSPIGTGGIVGATSANTSMTNITVGSISSVEAVQIKEDTGFKNPNTKEIPELNTYGTGGLLGRQSGGNLTLKKCNVLGYKKETGEYTTVISGKGSNVAGITGNIFKVNGNDVTVQGVYIDATRYAGGVVSWLESGGEFKLNNVNIKDVKITLSYKIGENKRGDIGGIVAEDTGTVTLTGATVDALVVESDYCNRVGAYVGYSSTGKLQVLQQEGSQSNENRITNCFLSGKNVGGVVGSLDNGDSNENKRYENITIANNKLVAGREDGVSYTIDENATEGNVGGFAGRMKATVGTQHIVAENILIHDNLIAGYDGKNNKARLGGVIGWNKYEANFFHLQLTDNYIGMMKKSELAASTITTTDTDAEKSAKRKKYLLETSIVDNGEGKGLRDNLYYATGSVDKWTSQSNPTETITKEQFYKYSYSQGAVIGIAFDGSSIIGIPKFIDVNIKYTDLKYRPVADVGTTSTNLSDNQAMYEEYRRKCAIVYDGRVTDDKTATIGQKFPGMDTSSEEIKQQPYVFDNLKPIMDNYILAKGTNEGVDDRTAYRLEENYLDGRTINADDSVTNYDKITAETIYQNTFYDGNNYKTPYEINGQKIPMIVYTSADCGDLNQVLQTYINILTNNSGGLNSYVNSSEDNIQNILTVTTYKMNVTSMGISMDTSENNTPSVSVSSSTENGIKKYSFTAGAGDDLTDKDNGTFTLVHVTYGWKKGENGTPQVKWSLDIPVYVEKRLKIYSNMQMIEGIQYNTKEIIEKGQHVIEAAGNKSAMTLTRGYSYSIYTEYIYVDSEKFKTAEIPKSLCIETAAQIYFSPGTRITLIALDEGSKPYYYEVLSEDTTNQRIDFTSFKDANGNAYTLKNIKRDSAVKRDSYTDICNTEYNSPVVLERYVLLVDTSAVTASRPNALYEMHISPRDMNYGLSSRTDFYEHCYELVNEIDGAAYKINRNTPVDSNTANTYLDAGSKISQDGSVKVHLQYDITADPNYWSSIRNADKIYMDVGFGLEVEINSGTRKVPLPSHTTVILGSGENQKSFPVADGQLTTYYYQSRRQVDSNTSDVICINDLGKNTSNSIDITFDFSSADLSSLEEYSESRFSVVAELVVMTDKNLPAAGEVKDFYRMSVGAETKSDIGFAMEVDENELKALGMNQYASEESDSGVVPYTASIAFPKNDKSSLEQKYFTIVYQIEEKTSQKDANGKLIYQPYSGDAIHLYLGKFGTKEAAKEAAKATTNTVCSGKGMVAVSYQFSTNDIITGADLQDGKTVAADSSVTKTPGVIYTHCTLVADCDSLNMTNYRVKAYLMVTDNLPGISSGGSSMNNQGLDNSGCLKGQLLRQNNWSTITGDEFKGDLKNDFFVFTVAKIKTSMQ